MQAMNERQAVVDLAHFCGDKGWLPATSGNLSARVSQDPLVMAITRSGADKPVLKVEDVILVGSDTKPIEATPHRASAETIVHAKLYDRFECGAIVHVHTLYNNLASDIYFSEGAVRFANHELLKALDHWEEYAAIVVPIVENYHDIPTLADAVVSVATEGVPGVLVRNHGIYVWGLDSAVAKRYLEAFEFLFQYDLLRNQFLR